MRAVVGLDVAAHDADLRAGRLGAPQERERRQRRARRPVVVEDAVMPAGRTQVLAQQTAGLRIQEADVEVVPLHLEVSPDPAGRRAVVRRLDFDAAIEMDGARAEAVVPKRLQRQRAQRRALLGKHHRDLALGRAVDARVGPARLPLIEIRLRGLEALEALPLQRRLLRMPHPGFDLALAIGIADATRQRDDAVVRQDIAIERIERRIVDVGREHALAEIVEDDDLHGAAQATKRLLVQLGPDRRAGAPRQQPNGLARIPERQDEEADPPVLPRHRVAHHRPIPAVVDLRFFPGRGRDDDPRLDRRWPRSVATKRRTLA